MRERPQFRLQVTIKTANGQSVTHDVVGLGIGVRRQDLALVFPDEMSTDPSLTDGAEWDELIIKKVAVRDEQAATV
jgi:hypothetical protein